MTISGITSTTGYGGYGATSLALWPTLTGGGTVGQTGSNRPSATTGQTVTTTATAAAAGKATGTGQPSQILAAAAGPGSTGTVLSAQQKAQIAQYKLLAQTAQADVQAQQRVAGPYAGTVSYQYERGPDGTLYAVAGDVTFNVEPVANNPAATVAAMQTITRAALSVVPPTAQDLLAVREAAQYSAEAQAALKSSRTAATTTNATTTNAAAAAKSANAAWIAQTQAVTAATATVLAAQQQAGATVFGMGGVGTGVNQAANQAGYPLTRAG